MQTKIYNWQYILTGYVTNIRKSIFLSYYYHHIRGIWSPLLGVKILHL